MRRIYVSPRVLSVFFRRRPYRFTRRSVGFAKNPPCRTTGARFIGIRYRLQSALVPQCHDEHTGLGQPARLVFAREAGDDVDLLRGGTTHPCVSARFFTEVGGGSGWGRARGPVASPARGSVACMMRTPRPRASRRARMRRRRRTPAFDRGALELRRLQRPRR